MELSIKLTNEEVSRLITRNTFLVSRLDERFKELDITSIKHEMDPTEITHVTQRIIQDEIWHLLRQLESCQRLIDNNR